MTADLRAAGIDTPWDLKDVEIEVQNMVATSTLFSIQKITMEQPEWTTTTLVLLI